MSNKVKDPTGLPYAGNGPSVNDDGTPALNLTRAVVGGGSDTTSLTATYTGADAQGTSPAGAVMGPNRSAGENEGSGFAPS
jgi:hypothetical protein